MGFHFPMSLNIRNNFFVQVEMPEMAGRKDYGNGSVEHPWL